jgi:putative addiction module killer protein
LGRGGVDLVYPFGYTAIVYTFLRTEEFSTWLKNLKDTAGKARILARLDAAELGNFGDSEPVGDGISEMRIHVGPGYRVYYSRTGKVIYLLLCGGDKSTQKKDIKMAKAILRSLEDEK